MLPCEALISTSMRRPEGVNVFIPNFQQVSFGFDGGRSPSWMFSSVLYSVTVTFHAMHSTPVSSTCDIALEATGAPKHKSWIEADRLTSWELSEGLNSASNAPGLDSHSTASGFLFHHAVIGNM